MLRRWRFLSRPTPWTIAVWFCTPILAQTNPAPKGRIAVLNFDYEAVDSDTLTSIFGDDQDVGKGIAAVPSRQRLSFAGACARPFHCPPWPSQ